MTTALSTIALVDRFIIDVSGAVPVWQSPRETEVLIAEMITEVTTPSDMDAALQTVTDLKAEIKDITTHFKPYNDAANRLRTRMAELRDTTLQGVDAHIKRLEGLVLAYRRDEQRRELLAQQERARLARVEAERVAAEKREAIRKEADRVAAEQSRIEDASAVLEQAELDAQDVRPVEVLPPLQRPLASHTAAVAKATGTGFTTHYSTELIDLLTLARAAVENPQAFLGCLAFNSIYADRMATLQKDDFNVPGVELVKREGIVSRGRKGK